MIQQKLTIQNFSQKSWNRAYGDHKTNMHFIASTVNNKKKAQKKHNKHAFET
jgi:hypothetical protein